MKSRKQRSFDELQRLLALKRHERPPQPFFSRLADNVLHNLDAPERPETMSWLQRVGVHFDVSPAVVGGVGISLAALLVAGMIIATRVENPLRADDPLLTTPNGEPVALGPQEKQPRTVPNPEAVPKSTAPMITPDSSTFSPQVEKAGFNTPTEVK